MGDLQISGDRCDGFTLVSNLFIDEYMKDANDAQLKVYLYLLRVLGSGRSTSISEMADIFNHTEKDVLRSLKYWEKCGLLRLSYNSGNELIGMNLSACVHSCAPVETAPSCKGKDASMPSVSAVVQASTDGGASWEEGTSKEKTSPSAAGENVLIMDSNRGRSSADCPQEKVSAYRETEKARNLLFVLQQYIPHPLTPNEIRSIYFMSDELGMSDDLIDYLVQYCVDRDKCDFRYMEKVAMNWVSQHITTAKQAAAYGRKYDKTIYMVMKALGKSAEPTDQEVAFIKRWIGDFGFSKEIILEACNRTVMATDSHRFSYADGILSRWYSDGIRTIAQVQKQDEAHKQKAQERAVSASAKTSAAKVSSDPFRQFEQRDYDFAALEKQLLSN